jgi:hypothetical protein
LQIADRFEDRLARLGEDRLDIFLVEPAEHRPIAPDAHRVRAVVRVRRGKRDVRDAVLRVINGLAQLDKPLMREPDAIDAHQHHGRVAMPERDGARPERIVYALRRPVRVETAQPHEVEVTVAVAILVRVALLRLELAVAIRVHPRIELRQVRRDVALRHADIQRRGISRTGRCRDEFRIHPVIPIRPVHADADEDKRGDEQHQERNQHAAEYPVATEEAARGRQGGSGHGRRFTQLHRTNQVP